MSTPTADDLRALARSSPWLWTSLHLTHRDHHRLVEAWVQRPDFVRVRRFGRPDHVARTPSGGGLVLTASAPGLAPAPTPPPPRPAALVAPVRRVDGLVLVRPSVWEAVYDEPFYDNYRWVAMLDPAELAFGVEMDAVRSEPREGRETWWARMRAVDGYDPRCSCCPLLWSEVSDRLEHEAGAGAPVGPWPTAYDVGLDRATGVVVSVQPVDGEAPYAWFETSLLEVDGPVEG